MMFIERCSFLLLLLMGVCNGNHTVGLVPNNWPITSDGNKECTYTKIYENKSCDLASRKVISTNGDNIENCVMLATSRSECNGNDGIIQMGGMCSCVRKGHTCVPHDAKHTVYSYICSATCYNKCSGTHIAKSSQNPGGCQGGVCKVNDHNCCEPKQCTTCGNDFYNLGANATPEGCNGHCPHNDGHCCAHKECSTCGAGWYAKANPTPELCSGNCGLNSSQCCRQKSCGSCYGALTAKNNQSPQDCKGEGNCYNNDLACCEAKVCPSCSGEYVALDLQAPAECDGQCIANDSRCCRHAPKSLLHENTHSGDIDITELFELSFSLTPFQKRSGMSNILHVTDKMSESVKETGSGDVVPAVSGDVVPAVYFKSNTLKLQACAECDGTVKCIYSDALTADTDYEVMLKMGEKTFSLRIDGTKVASVACVTKYQPAPDAVATLWTSNPWENAAFAHVEQVEYKSFLPVQDATVTGWQSVEYGMSCTSHRLMVGTGKTEAECKALCEANAMCHSIFFSEVGLRSCTLCPSYSPGPAIKLDTTTYVDPLNKYKMAQYRRPHIMDVQWYHYPVFSCEDEGFYDGLRILTKDECLSLAEVNGQNTLPASPFLRSGCSMSVSGEFFWTDEDVDFSPDPDSDTWNELLICKFEPENDGIELFHALPSAAFPRATDGNIQTCHRSKVDGAKNYVEIDVDGELSLMKVWIAIGTDNHVQHDHTADHTGTEVTVMAYNGHEYVPCATAKLSPRKQWTQVVCDTAVYAEKIRIESTAHAFDISDTRIFGITATSGTYLNDYPWTSQIAQTSGYEWHEIDNHRGCFGAGESTSAGTYKTQTCTGSTSKCVQQGRSTCKNEWKRCWGIGLKKRREQFTIEYYNVQAMNPLKCSGTIGLKEDQSWRVYQRRALQLYDVMVNSGPCWSFNWFTGEHYFDDWCDEPKSEAFAMEAIGVLHSIRECTVKDTVAEMKACYREMAAREVIGHKMFKVLADRKAETQQCVDDRRRAGDGLELDSGSEMNPETDFIATMRRRLGAIDVAKHGGSKNRAFIAAVSKRNPHRDETRRAELEYEHFEESSTYGEPWNRRRSSSEECWKRATMLNTLACDNLKGAAEVTLEVMKSRRSIALDEINLMNEQALMSFAGGFGGFIAGLAGGASVHAAGGPAGVGMGVASAFAGGLTDLFCGFADGANAISEATLARRETRAMLREIGAQEMQNLSDKVQVCDMPSTSDIQCMLGDLQEEITNEMRAGFDDLGSKVQNVLRALDDNHNEVMREFLKVEAVLAGNTIQLSNLRDKIDTVLHDLSVNTNLLFDLGKLGAIEEAQQWFAMWSEEDEETRITNFQSPQGNFWCNDLVEKMGSTLLPGYIRDWVASAAFKALAKPSSCTPPTYATQYTLHYKSFESLFEFVAMMQLYINEYSEITVSALNAVRLDMAGNYRNTLKDIQEMTSC